MRRTEIDIVVFNPATGIAVNAAVVQIRKRSDGTLATVYLAEAGSTTIANPLTTDVYGRVPGWVDRGDYYAEISGTGLADYVLYFDSAPGADGAVDNAWHEPGSITADKLNLLAQTTSFVGTQFWSGPAAFQIPFTTPPALSNGQWMIFFTLDMDFTGSTTTSEARLGMTLDGVDQGNTKAIKFNTPITGSNFSWPLSGSQLLTVTGAAPTKELGFKLTEVTTGNNISIASVYSNIAALRVS